MRAYNHLEGHRLQELIRSDHELFLDFGKYKGRHIKLDDGYLRWTIGAFSESSLADTITASGKIKERMKQQNLIGNVHNLLKDLKSCSLEGDLQWGRRIHEQAMGIQNGSNIYVMTALIKMYCKCGSMVDARRVFDSIQKPDIVFWTTLLVGYVENGEVDVALDMFSMMKEGGCAPDSFTYVAALKACTSLAGNGDGNRKRECLKRGREIHLDIGHHIDHILQNVLVDMYGKCGSMVDARRVFDSIQKPDVVSWTTLLLGYVGNGEGVAALDMFFMMKAAGKCPPNSVTYVAALKACTSLAVNRMSDCLIWGREIHSEINHHLNRYVQNTLIDMYNKCGSMVEARQVFENVRKPDVITWTALIQGYVENGEGMVALEMFSMMKAARACPPNSVTYVAVLQACTSLAVNGDGNGKGECLRRGREIHSEIGRHLTPYLQSALIDMYGKCGSMTYARLVFDGIRRPDVVSWNSLILGYAENGEEDVALDMFSRMKALGRCPPTSVTYVAAIKACGLIGALAIGQKFHLEISEFTTNIVTCLVDFYAKCGSIIKAQEVFDSHSKLRDVATWNALIAGYGSFGETVSVFYHFEAMKEQGFQPDYVTFLCILSCCSHAGLVDKAMEYFEAMPMQYGLVPTEMHYNCMVDVLGRANQLKMAVSLLRKMPYISSAVTWRTLLSACCKWKNVDLGRYAFQCLLDMDEKNPSAYVLMARLYGSVGMWKDQERVLKARIKLEPALSLPQTSTFFSPHPDSRMKLECTPLNKHVYGYAVRQ